MDIEPEIGMGILVKPLGNGAPRKGRITGVSKDNVQVALKSTYAHCTTNTTIHNNIPRHDILDCWWPTPSKFSDVMFYLVPPYDIYHIDHPNDAPINQQRETNAKHLNMSHLVHIPDEVTPNSLLRFCQDGHYFEVKAHDVALICDQKRLFREVKYLNNLRQRMIRAITREPKPEQDHAE